MYIHIYIGSRLGCHGTQLICIMFCSNIFWTCWFYTGVYSVFCFESICMTIENVTWCADKLQVYPRRNIIMLQLSGMAKNVCLMCFFHRNYCFMHLLSLCWLLKHVMIHWRTVGHMTITPFLIFTPTKAFETAASKH